MQILGQLGNIDCMPTLFLCLADLKINNIPLLALKAHGGCIYMVVTLYIYNYGFNLFICFYTVTLFIVKFIYTHTSWYKAEKPGFYITCVLYYINTTMHM